MPRESERPWYEIAFGELYPLLYPHRDDASADAEVAALERLLAHAFARARVLDVGCGTGRHAAALARRGAHVTALDLSPQLLARARRRPELASGRLIRADMRRLPLRGGFDLAVNLFTSFGYFPTEEENAGVLAELARMLRPGGHLVLDHANRAALESQLVPADTRRAPGLVIHQTRRLVGSRVQKQVSVERDDGRRERYTEDVRLYRPAELAALLAAAGFADVHCYGGFAGQPLTPVAPRMILVARRTATHRAARAGDARR